MHQFSLSSMYHIPKSSTMGRDIYLYHHITLLSSQSPSQVVNQQNKPQSECSFESLIIMSDMENLHND